MLNDTDTQVMKDYIHRNALDLLLMEQTIDQLKMENKHLIGDDNFENLNKQRMYEDRRDLNNYSSLKRPIPNNSKLTNYNTNNSNNYNSNNNTNNYNTSNKPAPKTNQITTNKNTNVQQNDVKKRMMINNFNFISLKFFFLLFEFYYKLII